MVLGEVPRVLPVPGFPGTISPGFGSADVIIGRPGTSESTPRFVCKPRDIASSWLLLEQCERLFKDFKDKLKMAIVVSDLWFC